MLAVFLLVAGERVQGAETTITVTAVVLPGTQSNSPGQTSGGGGAFSELNTPTSVSFAGTSFPGARITILTDGVLTTSATTTAQGAFTIVLPAVTIGNHVFTINSIDTNGFRSSNFLIPLLVAERTTLTVSGIVATPVMWADQSAVKQGDNLIVSGLSSPGARVTIRLKGPSSALITTRSNNVGLFRVVINTKPFLRGTYTLEASVIVGDKETPASRPETVLLGDTTTFNPAGTQTLLGDFNADQRVNLVDFSMIAFWYAKPGAPAQFDLNNDGQIDLKDFSIMAFYWTG